MAQPVIIEDNISIAANSVNPNVIASNPSLARYLRSPFPARGKLLATASAAGLVVDFDYGSKNVVAGATVRTIAIMQEPYDVLNDSFWVNEGDQNVLRVSNTTGGAVSIRYRLVLEPWDGEFPPDMRTMQSSRSIAAGVVDSQLLAGLRYERPPQDCLLTVLMSGSAAGLLRQINVDTDSVSPAAAVNPTNQVPINPLDSVISGIEVPQDKLIELSVSNPTGGALTAFWKTLLQETYRQ